MNTEDTPRARLDALFKAARNPRAPEVDLEKLRADVMASVIKVGPLTVRPAAGDCLSRAIWQFASGAAAAALALLIYSASSQPLSEYEAAALVMIEGGL